MNVNWHKIGCPYTRKPNCMHDYIVAGEDKVWVSTYYGTIRCRPNDFIPFDGRYGPIYPEYWAELPPLPKRIKDGKIYSTQGDWISIYEKQPEPLEKIAATDGEEVWRSWNYSGYILPNGKRVGSSLYYGENLYVGRKVIWWLKLPEPPEKKGKS